MPTINLLTLKLSDSGVSNFFPPLPTEAPLSKQFLTLKEASIETGEKPETLRKKCQSGIIRGISPDKRHRFWRIHCIELLKYICEPESSYERLIHDCNNKRKLVFKSRQKDEILSIVDNDVYGK